MPRVEFADFPSGLYVWHCCETEDELWSLVELSSWERVSFEQMQSVERLREKLACRALLQSVLGVGARFEYSACGAPRVGGRAVSVAHSTFPASVRSAGAHSGCYVVVYLGGGDDGADFSAIGGHRCGVDIEAVGRDARRVVPRISVAGELEVISGALSLLSSADVAVGMDCTVSAEILLWCAKEAIFKFAAQGDLSLQQDVRVVGAYQTEAASTAVASLLGFVGVVCGMEVKLGWLVYDGMLIVYTV